MADDQLELVRAFANTLDVEEGTDRLATTAGLESWLEEHGFNLRVNEDELDLAVRARDGIRALIRATHHDLDEDNARALAGLADVVDTTGLVPRFRPGSVRLEPGAAGVAGVLGGLLAHVDEAIDAGTWPRLKLCLADDCRWAFYDESRNRSGRWCDMAVCGNRAKVRSYRARQGS